MRAIEYADLGYPVLPLHYPTATGSCSCGKADCTSIGKHPCTPRGLTDASTDPDQIRAWAARWPKANWAIRTDDLTVIDIDPKNGGHNTWAQLINDHGAPPATLTVLTGLHAGTRGQHLYYRTTPLLTTGANVMGEGIDVRSGAGGYVVAPASLHPSGVRYEIEEHA